jgi:hypothetical protein
MRLDEVIRFDELPDNELTVIPAGWYTATIAEAEVKTAKRGDGQYLSVRYTILGPTHQGRSVYGNVTLRNASETATRIGRAQLKELMGAVGLAQLADTDQLVGATLQVRVTVRDDLQYGQSNEVKGWKPAGAQAPVPRPVPPSAVLSTPAPAPVPTPAQPQPQPRPSNRPPWA